MAFALPRLKTISRDFMAFALPESKSPFLKKNLKYSPWWKHDRRSEEELHPAPPSQTKKKRKAKAHERSCSSERKYLVLKKDEKDSKSRYSSNMTKVPKSKLLST
jgi:hypothetical protein